jgi:hypothetical protein
MANQINPFAAIVEPKQGTLLAASTEIDSRSKWTSSRGPANPARAVLRHVTRQKSVRQGGYCYRS